MRFPTIAMLAALAAITIAAGGYAEAARLGGGKSLGTQRQSIAPPHAAPAPNSGAASQPVMPASPGATLPARPATPPAAAPSGMSRWLGPIAGIAAGLGLAALLSHFGLPEGAGSFLLLALLVIGGIFLVRMLFARRTPATSPMQYAGTGSQAGMTPPVERDAPVWGGAPKPLEPVVSTASPAGATAARAIPPGFDVPGFVRQAKQQFIRLQAAYDSGDVSALSDVMTPDMLKEVRRDLESRGAHRATEVVSLEADVLEVVTEGNQHWASVRYTGLVREDGEPNPKPLDEVWNLAKPVDGSTGWLLAGIQQYA
jgi:predicted lipid-binding transport protein (Tim44 family)